MQLLELDDGDWRERVRDAETANEKGFRPVWKSKSAREHRVCSPRGHNYRAASARNPLLYINSRDSRLCRVTERATSLVTGGTKGQGSRRIVEGSGRGGKGERESSREARTLDRERSSDRIRRMGERGIRGGRRGTSK